MLEINDTQAEIIKVFLDNYRDKTNEISEGLSGNELESYGIITKTFRNNRDYFLKNYFLRLSKVEYHGQRNYFYFQITRLGILSYLKWSSKKSKSDFWLDKDFFPLMWKHWDTLVDIFGESLFDILQSTIESIEIKPQYTLQFENEKTYGGKLNESIWISLGKIEVKFFREYDSPQLQSLPNIDAWKQTEHFTSLNQEIDDKITARYTFLLFFNLLNSGLSPSALAPLLTNRITHFDLNKESLTEKDMEDKKIEIEKVINEVKQNSEKLFSIILDDGELYKLLKESIVEITQTFSNRPALKIMSEKFGLQY